MRGPSGWISTAMPVTALAAVAAGCGRPSSPTAPLTPVQDALSSLSVACGHALEARAIEHDRPAVAAQDRSALAPAHRLIALLHAGPSATYLGEPMTEVVSVQVSAARSCGLDRTARRLAAALRREGRS